MPARIHQEEWLLMKLIHCADLHLDSRMESGLPQEKARERRLELLRTFTRMVEMAEREGVEAILICGDLFDARTVSSRARNCVLDAVLEHPGIIFYYLQGNHDQNSFLAGLRELPENLKTFGHDWTTYEQGDTHITGAEITEKDTEGLMERLCLDAGQTNLVMLHGTAIEYGAKDADYCFSLKPLRGKGIDYLALGHLHSYRAERLDERGIWCYSGCLEGRGFDECGEKGYTLLESGQGKVSQRFIPFAQRKLHKIPVDISGLRTQEEIQHAVEESLMGVPKEDLVEVVLQGEVPPEAEKDARWLQKWLEDACYFLKVKDETRASIHPEDYRYDISLKGEFVRLVLSSDMPEEEKNQVLRLGIRALAGED